MRALLRWFPLWLALLAPALAGSPSPKVLHVGVGVDPQDLDPQIITGIPEARILRALCEGLVIIGPDGNLAPGVAQSWETSADGLQLTFRLRPEARWSDGRPLTAQDFVASYQRILTASLGARNAERLYPVVGAEDFHRGRLQDFSRTGFAAPENHLLRLTLRQPATFLLQLLTMPEWLPVPLHVITQVGRPDQPGNRWTRPEHFVGNVAFALRAWRPAQPLVVARSPTYWGRAAVRLDEIHFHPIEDAAVEERLFRQGRLHLTQTVPAAKIAPYRREQPESLRIDPFGGLYYYVCNTRRPPFDDPRVRRALALALDREALTRHVSQAGEEPAYSAVRPGLAGYPGAPAFRADPTEARRLLAAAGFPGGRGFPRVELLYNTAEQHRALAEAVQQRWRRELGIEITLLNQEWTVYLDAINRSHSFQLARGGWVVAEPHIHLERWQTGHATNQAGWSHAGYDRLLAAALAAPTTAERYARYREMEAILAEEMPFIPVYFHTLPRLVSPKVIGYRTTLEDAFPWAAVDLQP
jgi:oligopeptide transport system substrate-binding protein